MSGQPAAPVARGRGGGWILPVLLILIIGLPILEVWLLIRVGSWIGVWPTLAILVAEAFLGGWLMRREGNRAWKTLNEAFASGKMPTGELADAALVLVGGVLLMLPGFVTDIIGFFFLLPFTRPLARRLLAYFVGRRLRRFGVVSTGYYRGDGTVIEGETVADPGPQSSRKPSEGPVVIAGEIEDGKN